MPVINFISQFSSCDSDILGIKHNAHIPIISIGCICWLILALKHGRYLRCQSPKNLVEKVRAAVFVSRKYHYR